ncbi:MAG: hypothetical protein U0K87_15840, partial [Ruminococcus sp.]|nr:hypothetical protein [Ruminococcus sp.]
YLLCFCRSTYFSDKPRIIEVCGLRSKIFRQDAQMKRGKAVAFPRFFGLSDGARRKQGVRLELCGVALIVLIGNQYQ